MKQQDCPDAYGRRTGKRACDKCGSPVPVEMLKQVTRGPAERRRMVGIFCPQCLPKQADHEGGVQGLTDVELRKLARCAFLEEHAFGICSDGRVHQMSTQQLVAYLLDKLTIEDLRERILLQ